MEIQYAIMISDLLFLNIKNEKLGQNKDLNLPPTPLKGE